MVSEMHREYGKFHFGRRDLHIEVSRGLQLVTTLGSAPPDSVAKCRVTGVDTMDGTKLLCDDESWLLFRQSGTEPVLRVYAEATSVDKMNALLEVGSALALDGGRRS